MRRLAGGNKKVRRTKITARYKRLRPKKASRVYVSVGSNYLALLETQRDQLFVPMTHTHTHTHDDSLVYFFNCVIPICANEIKYNN